MDNPVHAMIAAIGLACAAVRLPPTLMGLHDRELAYASYLVTPGTLPMKSWTVREAILELSPQAQFSFSIEPVLGARVVKVGFRSVPLYEALRSILDPTGGTYVIEAGLFNIRRR